MSWVRTILVQAKCMCSKRGAPPLRMKGWEHNPFLCALLSMLSLVLLSSKMTHIVCTLQRHFHNSLFREEVKFHCEETQLFSFPSQKEEHVTLKAAGCALAITEYSLPTDSWHVTSAQIWEIYTWSKQSVTFRPDLLLVLRYISRYWLSVFSFKSLLRKLKIMSPIFLQKK